MKKVGNKLMKFLGILVLLGLGLALLRIFNYDPFGVIDWLFSWFVKIINFVADVLTGSEHFRNVTEKP